MALVEDFTSLAAAGAAVALLLFASAQLPGAEGRKHQSQPLLIPPAQLEHFTFGQNELVADLLWLRSLQDVDYCGAFLETKQYVPEFQRELTICKQGWIYQMLDAVTRIVPRYKIVYMRATIYLSVLINDIEGAAKLFDRGTEVFPDNWYIHYSAGYHYQFEVKDPAKAAYHMERAAKLGAPQWAVILAAKLFSSSGKAEYGLRALAQYYGKDPFDKWPARAQERWRELEGSLGKTVDPAEFLQEQPGGR
jgi:hypothetical protein